MPTRSRAARSTSSRTRRGRISSGCRPTAISSRVSFPSLSNYFIGLNAQQTTVRLRRRQRPPGRSRTRSTASRSPTRSSSARPLRRTGRSRRTSSGTSRGSSSSTSSIPRRRSRCSTRPGWTEGSGGIREKGGQKLSFTITSNDNYQPTTAAIDQAIVPMLADVGVEMKLNVPDAAEYFGIVAAAAAPEKALLGRRVGLRVAVVVAGRPAHLLPGLPEHGLQRRPARISPRRSRSGRRRRTRRRSRRPRASSSSPGPSSFPRSRS